MQVAWVQSLVRELWSHMPCGKKKKTNCKTELQFRWGRCWSMVFSRQRLREKGPRNSFGETGAVFRRLVMVLANIRGADRMMGDSACDGAGPLRAETEKWWITSANLWVQCSIFRYMLTLRGEAISTLWFLALRETDLILIQKTVVLLFLFCHSCLSCWV